MDVWCDVLLSFMDSFTKATASTTTTSSSSSSTTQCIGDNSVDNNREANQTDDNIDNTEDESKAIASVTTPTRKLSFTFDNSNQNCSYYDNQSDEVFHLLIKCNFLRWTMQQLSRILLFIHQRNSTLCCGDDSRSDSLSTTGSSSNGGNGFGGVSGVVSGNNKTLSSSSKVSPKKRLIHPSYHRLQPIMVIYLNVHLSFILNTIYLM